MGRVLSSQQLLLGQDARLNITLTAAATESGLNPSDFAEALSQLLLLLPDLKSGLNSLSSKVLAQLLLDIPGVAVKLVSRDGAELGFTRFLLGFLLGLFTRFFY
jgi:hypothetical protein